MVTMPRYSFLIPSSGRASRLRGTLNALAALGDAADTSEVVLVIDGPASGLPLSDLLAGAGRMPVTVIEQARSGPARARNVAAAHARGEWLVFLDDDCRVGPDVLGQLGRVLRSDAGVAFGGQPSIPGTATIWSAASHIVVETFIASCRHPSGAFAFLPSQNLVVHRTAWQRMGGFSERFRAAGGEDREFCRRWVNGGGRLQRLPGLGYVHDDRLTAWSFLRKHFRYGEGAALVPHLPGLGWYLTFLTEAVRQIAAHGWWRQPGLIVALVASQVASATGRVFAEAPRRAAAPAAEAR